MIHCAFRVGGIPTFPISRAFTDETDDDDDDDDLSDFEVGVVDGGVCFPLDVLFPDDFFLLDLEADAVVSVVVPSPTPATAAAAAVTPLGNCFPKDDGDDDVLEDFFSVIFLRPPPPPVLVVELGVD